MNFPRLIALCTTLLAAGAALADDFRLKVEEAAPGIFALVGPLGDRSYENHGLNSTHAVIDTPDGAILIDSGASRLGAQLLESEAKRLTGKPVRWVINTGSQDHRWLGNAWFIAQGAEVIAHARTVKIQQAEVGHQLERLAPALRERLDGTEPAQATRVIEVDTETLVLGGRTLRMHYFADAHFAGDVVLWMPDTGTLFAGDHVYVDRILSIRPFSSAEGWLEAFGKLAALAPTTIVPGHGSITDLGGAQRDTGDYLAFVVEGARRFAEDMAGAEEALAELGDAPQFERLQNYNELHRANVHQAYLQIEAGH